MIKQIIADEFNAQANREFYSAYLYLSMAGYFEQKNLNGFSNWMRVQAQEELTHAMKFFDYILERGGKTKLEAIDRPQTEWSSLLSAFEDAYKHELFISENINRLTALAIDEKDYAANNFLQWFVTEQVEEESSVDNIVQKLRLVGDNGSGIFMIDNELAARVFTPPAASNA